MRTLTTVTRHGLAQPTATLTLKTGREIWLCNPVDELTEAMGAGEPFRGHTAKAMKAHPLIVNPAHVATIEAHDPQS